MDWVIIIQYGYLFGTNEFQFDFQQLSSTSLCSWMVSETIDYYLRNGSQVYGCLLDCTKAFDTVQHSKLFLKLVDARVPLVVIRLLICIYRNQTARVRWNSDLSEEFPIRNGVRQGAVISPLFFSFYMDSLFNQLSQSGSGCQIGEFYAGCFGYADDLFLLSPSRKGLQEMLDISEAYVKEHSISFSTDPDASKSKTKGIIFSRKPLKLEPEPVKLDGNPLPWVKQAKYLGNTIECVPNGHAADIKVKRARYIERNVEINHEFPDAHPDLKCKLNTIYNSSFPGSVLYDLFSDSTSLLVNSWSISVRQMWNLPYSAHKYVIEPLGGSHAYTMLLVRFIRFLQNAHKSPKLSVQLMLQKVINSYDTLTGRNLLTIQKLAETEENLMNMSISKLKSKLKFCPISENDQWKITLIKEITDLKQNTLEFSTGDSEEDLFLDFDQLTMICNHISST